MRRREFITLLGGAAMAWPLAARGQQSAMPVIGILNSGAAAPFAPMMAAFDRGLSEQGYVVGRNVKAELRWADGRYEKLPELAADLARFPVDVLASPGGDVATVASMAATKTIPVVFMVGRDPVKASFVANLSADVFRLLAGGLCTLDCLVFYIFSLVSRLFCGTLILLRAVFLPHSLARHCGQKDNPTQSCQ